MLEGSETLAYALLSSEARVLEANGVFAENLGITRSEVVGVRLTGRVTEGQRGRLERLLLGLSEKEPGEATEPFFMHFDRGNASPVTLRVWLRPTSGGVELMGEPATGDVGRLEEALVKLNSRISDLSRENVKKAAELEKALADLKAAQATIVHQEKMASLGQMTAGVAHELNNPLAYVINNQHLLRRFFGHLLGVLNLFGESLDAIEEADPALWGRLMDEMERVDLPHIAEAVPRLLASSEEGLDRARGIVSDLRAFSRLDEAAVKEVDLNEGLRSALRFLEPLAREQGCSIVAELRPLPPVTCEAGQVQQAFANIVANAVQAAGAGGTVRVTTQADEGWLCVQVQDDGPGIPSDALPHIFEPFFTTKAVGEGTGLGLSIAHTVIQRQGGSIEVETSLGEGACFRVWLPIMNRT
jgi:signal transduction histidine kinase